MQAYGSKGFVVFPAKQTLSLGQKPIKVERHCYYCTLLIGVSGVILSVWVEIGKTLRRSSITIHCLHELKDRINLKKKKNEVEETRW